MEYTDDEKELLSVLDRTNFQHLSKGDLFSFVSRINEMRPEVAKEVLSHYPELTEMIHTTLAEYKGILDNVVKSNDDSVTRVYNILDNELNGASESRKEYYEMAGKIREDASKCLDDPNMTAEQKEKILDQEMEILRMSEKNDAEIREHEKEIAVTADKKDSENKQFDYKLLAAASSVVLIAASIGAAALGGKVNLKLPKMK